MPMPSELLDGYRRFRSGRYTHEVERYLKLAGGQSPSTMIIACADSRVDPATIFAAGPGELFVVRNVAALVPPYEAGGGYHGNSAAVEFAVEGLGVENILVMGHSFCGGVQAAIAAASDQPVGEFIRPWVGLLSDARDALLRGPSQFMTPEALQHEMESVAVRVSLENLMTFHFVRKAVEAGKLRLHGARFSIAAGELQWRNRQTGQFETVSSGE